MGENRLLPRVKRGQQFERGKHALGPGHDTFPLLNSSQITAWIFNITLVWVQQKTIIWRCIWILCSILLVILALDIYDSTWKINPNCKLKGSTFWGTHRGSFSCEHKFLSCGILCIYMFLSGKENSVPWLWYSSKWNLRAWQKTLSSSICSFCILTFSWGFFVPVFSKII